ncbi:KAP family P-loop NTPase fold protein [Flagellimonas myxillae]|uniref:KAP family P-loop NTPase fold protein n=1 Tax=Flagellimonas myxillae TaxID=2942214 RepID=UPI00201E9F41|nr:P-loop NTPase fold protein [Muricauda myxillae]MCL6264923.1 KAP family NTPase [Muricauda myxillae]
MELRNKEIIIGENPFENCLLEREQYANVLTSIISNYKKGFVLAIDNEWGTGKTTFVKMWQKYLENKDYRTIYFNAWENDFQDEVIVALLSELKKLQDDSEELFAKVLNKTLPLLKNVGLELLKHAVGKATGDKAVELIAEGVGEYTLDSLQQGLNDFEEKKNSIQEFRECLKDYVNSGDDENPIVFIIDELDRCRPNYAVEILEKMKHLFNVEGVVFVISIDKIQLGHSIRGVYGSEYIDSNEYLRRFIDVEFSLPKPDVKDYTLFLTTHFGLRDFYTSTDRIRHGEFSEDLNALVFMLDLIQKSNNPTLRQLEKMLGLFSILIKSLSFTQKANPMCILFIIFLKVKNNDGFYEKLVERKLDLQELLDKTLELFYPLKDEKMLNFFVWFQAEILFYYWRYLKEIDKSVILFEGDASKDDFRITVENKADKDYCTLISNIRGFASSYRERTRVDFIGRIIPHIELTKIVV